MLRPADTTFDLHDLLRNRWSPVSFSDQLLTPAELGSLFEAARWTPSAYNEQPWSFIVGTRDDPAQFERVLSCLVDANQTWARHAPLLMITVAKRRFDRNGKENAHAAYDLGQAAAHLTIQAAAMGLFVHQMAGFDPQRARELFDIPSDHDATSAIAVGHFGPAADLPAEVAARDEAPRQRKPLTAFVFGETWGTAARAVQG
jgi:nitroreductase